MHETEKNGKRAFFFQAMNIKITMEECVLTQNSIYQSSSKKYLNDKLNCAGILGLVLAKT